MSFGLDPFWLSARWFGEEIGFGGGDGGRVHGHFLAGATEEGHDRAGPVAEDADDDDEFILAREVAPILADQLPGASRNQVRQREIGKRDGFDARPFALGA